MRKSRFTEEQISCAIREVEQSGLDPVRWTLSERWVRCPSRTKTRALAALRNDELDLGRTPGTPPLGHQPRSVGRTRARARRCRVPPSWQPWDRDHQGRAL